MGVSEECHFRNVLESAPRRRWCGRSCGGGGGAGTGGPEGMPIGRRRSGGGLRLRLVSGIRGKVVECLRGRSQRSTGAGTGSGGVQKAS